MAQETVWVSDITDIHQCAFRLINVLKEILIDREELEKNSKEISFNIRMIVSISRKLLEKLSKNRLMDPSQKETLIAVTTNCRDLAIKLGGKADTLPVLKKGNFVSQIKSMLEDCKKIIKYT